MFDNIAKFLKKFVKNKEVDSKDTAKERLHLVLMQDRANVSADFLDLMKQEIIDVIKKYIDVDENSIDVKLTNKTNGDGTTGAPILYANIPIVSIKDENKNKVMAKDDKQVKTNKQQENDREEAKKEEKDVKENKEIIKDELPEKEEKKEIKEEDSNKAIESVQKVKKVEIKKDKTEQNTVKREDNKKEITNNKQQITKNGKDNKKYNKKQKTEVKA